MDRPEITPEMLESAKEKADLLMGIIKKSVQAFLGIDKEIVLIVHAGEDYSEGYGFFADIEDGEKLTAFMRGALARLESGTMIDAMPKTEH